MQTKEMKKQIKICQWVIAGLMVVGAVTLVGCGQGTTGESESGNGAEAAKATEQAASGGNESTGESESESAPAKTIEITANDQMQFGVESFTVSPGERVKIVLKNVGTMPKVSMGHNLVLLKMGVDVMDFANAASMKAATDYVPEDRADDIIVHTKLLGPDETDSVTFKAPAKKGDYDYLCSFPGHVQAGMRGVMHVE